MTRHSRLNSWARSTTLAPTSMKMAQDQRPCGDDLTQVPLSKPVMRTRIATKHAGTTVLAPV